MRTAIFKYDYENYGCYRVGAVNIGDHIQSIAASQYFDHIDTYIDRDKLYNVQDDTCVIGNGWYLLDEKRHSISESVNFLPVSIHIANQNDKSAKIIANLAHRNMPVGCRDLSTMEFLQSHGIEAYFSSCLTTTLSRDFILKDCKEKQERKGIIFADARIDKLKIFPVTRLLDQWKKKNKFAPVHQELYNLMERFESDQIEITSHNCSFSKTHAQRFELAMELLKKYASAKCVITSRIHCALPCLGLGTPVVLITNTFDQGRFRGLDNFLNHIYMHKDGSLSKIIETQNGEIINSTAFYEKANELRNRCSSFTKRILK